MQQDMTTDPEGTVAGALANGQVTATEMAALIANTRTVVTRIYDWIKPAPDEYPDFEILIWTNHPQGVITEMQSGQTDKFYGALRKLIKQHSGLQMECEVDVLSMQPVLDLLGKPVMDDQGEPMMAEQPTRDAEGEVITEVVVREAPPAEKMRAFIEFIPQELANAITFTVARRAQTLPNSTRRLNQS